MARKTSSPCDVPKQIVIAHTTYAVQRNDDECDALGSDGHTLVGGRRIVIRSGLHPDREQEVVLHEALHACVGATTLDISDEDEELLVASLTGPALDLIRRNPELIAFLQQ